MARYGCHFSAFTTATSVLVPLGLHANAAGENFEAVDFIMSGAGTVTPADIMHEARVAACTFATAGTAGANPTPQPFDDFSPAGRVLVGTAYSSSPTVIATVYPVLFGFNQRGGMRIGWPQGDGLKFHNANANKGLTFLVISNSAGSVSGSVNWLEP